MMTPDQVRRTREAVAAQAEGVAPGWGRVVDLELSERERDHIASALERVFTRTNTECPHRRAHVEFLIWIVRGWPLDRRVPMRPSDRILACTAVNFLATVADDPVRERELRDLAAHVLTWGQP